MIRLKISIKTLSELSGFSPATVSNALNHKHGVNAETAKKILEIARESGYFTAENVKNIRVVTYRDSGEVFSDSPFFSTLLESVTNESHSHGYETVVVNLYRRKPDYAERVGALLSDTSSAILLVGTELDEETAEPFCKAPVPLVLLDACFPTLSFHAALMENEDSVYQAVRHLISLGHRRIGYLRGSVRIRNFTCRERGLRLALQEHDLTLPDGLVFDVPPSISGAYEAFSHRLAEGRELPTAFFADNDMIALGAVQAMLRRGIRVPEDVSVIGFDDISFCEVFSPGLTTVRVHNKELGRVAVRKLLELVKRPETVPSRTVLCNELILRGSVAPPAQARAGTGG